MNDVEIEDFGVTVTTKLLVEFNKASKSQPTASDTTKTLMGLDAMSVLLDQYRAQVKQGLR
jgi:hypothetical protein